VVVFQVAPAPSGGGIAVEEGSWLLP
jgi:hypothetical protein